MSEEKLYAVKNDEGKYFDCEYAKFLPLSESYCPVMVSEDNAKAIVGDYGGHVVALVEEPKKLVLSKEEARIVEDAHGYMWPAKYIADNTDGGYESERLLMEAYVNGYTVAKEKKYLVYKELGGKQKHEQFAQAYRSSVYPGTVRWILTNEVINRSFAQFTEAEIEHYGLQDCDKEEVTDDEQ
ncbi:DUF1642 domain-containing protein [Lacticaseibacillus paracasei]|uniref:DUF1642 domain-containing protein n=1 Tax=Lacticaseibacillus paracasei TaxID=1597 RepID=UPI001891782F|nr:DUF1642 domain-containing protein [Lacticaseibacillus paracasei]QPB56683.1 DUF1642 domain-containing protein [Lacticaseibacillus paracasei]WPQ31752.1 DUF1642 domain-containing protein [Lacticaseibacillus paracasei]